jgi:tRNA-dihydrouridine synthase B
MKNFWEKLKKPARPHDGSGAGGPFFCLAPMSDVTDAAFRRIISKYGKPDVFWTEFVSADGLVSEGRKVLKNNLIFGKKEKPIVVQLFSSNPEKMREAAEYVAKFGFDGIDINMGCPDKSVEKQGAGAAMMKDMTKAGEIIRAVKDGIKNSGKKVSISVKTRVGYSKNQIDEWIPFLLSQNIDALTIHARTRKDMSKIPADWEYVKKVVEIRNKMKVKTKIIGNGDVLDIWDGKGKAEETGCDGIMIGRAIFGNPWLFSGKIPSVKEKLKVLIEHTKLFERLFGKVKSFAVMKKHFAAYVNGFDGAKELRMKLMETKSAKEVEVVIDKFLKNN